MLLFSQAEVPLQNPTAILLLVASLLVAVILLVAVFTFLSLFRLWLHAFLSGANVTFFDLVGMSLRRTNARVVVHCRVMSVQAGTPIPVKELEAAVLSGANIELATRAYIDAAKSGKKFTFEELVDADRSQQLAEMLGMKQASR